MAKRWSKLQSRLYNLMDPFVNFQIHCCLYEMNSNDGYHGFTHDCRSEENNPIPFFFTLIIF